MWPPTCSVEDPINLISVAEADPWFNFHTKSGKSTSFRTDGCAMRNLVVDLTNAAKLLVYEDEFSNEL